jgi:phage terminase large subunit-like protein
MARKAVDPVTKYAQDVCGGRSVASRLVRQACKRHLSDLESQRAKGLSWRPEEAQRIIDFFASVLCLPEDTDADEQSSERDREASVEPTPFVLSPFQEFIAGSLMGWYTQAGHRRFREAYIETAKGSGKTPFGAGLMLYMLVADGERGAQVFAAANSRDQAKLAFTDAERMVAASPHLAEILDQKANNLAVLETGSFFRPISAEKRGLDGKRVHGALIDELHEHQNATVVNKMRKGTKGRRNALILKITNSGFDRQSVCWKHHEYSRKVLDGTVANETWFAFVCGLDPCDSCAEQGHWFPVETCPTCDDWKTEGPHWQKANPNLGVSLPWQYLRDLVTQAKGMPSEVSDLLRFNFCVWTQAQSRAINMGAWQVCQAMPSDEELAGVPCFAALDLGLSDDFCARAKLWPLEDGRVAVKLKFWIPELALRKYPDRPYKEWERLGILEVTEGDTTDYQVIQDDTEAECADVVSLAYDPRFANQMAQHLQGCGINVVPTPQGFQLNEPTKRFLELIADGELCHGNNAILTWMASNFVVRHGPNKQIRPDKETAPEKIDGIVATIMAIDQGLIRTESGPSVYDDPDYDMVVV